MRLYVEEHKGAPTIAKQLGIGASCVYRYLKDAGISRDYKTRGPLGRGNKIFTEEQEVEIIASYRAGLCPADIARQLGAKPATIRQVLMRLGEPLGEHDGRRAKSIPEETISTILRLQNDGISQDRISREVGIGQTGISHILRQHGISGQKTMDRHPSWKGGRIDMNGYIAVKTGFGGEFPSMAHNSGYTLEHRLVMAKVLGRELSRGETVHHINGDRTDNRPDNLQLRHGRHGGGRQLRCADCGSSNIATVTLT